MRKILFFCAGLLPFLLHSAPGYAAPGSILADLVLSGEERVTQLVATSDMKNWAAVIETPAPDGERQYSLVTDSGRRAPFSGFDLHSLRFTSDGMLIFSAAVPGTEAETEWYLHRGENRSGPFHGIAGVSFAPDGSFHSFLEQREDGTYFLHTGDELSGPFDSVSAVETQSEITRAFRLTSDQGIFLLAGNRLFGPFDSVDGIRTSLRSGTVAFRFSREGKTFLFDGKAEQGPFEESSVPLIAPDGKSVAYTYRNGASWSVVQNGRRVGTHPSVGELYFTGDSSRVVYWVKERERHYLISGTAKLGPYSAPGVVRYPPGKTFLAHSLGLDNGMYLFTGRGHYGPYRTIHDISYSADGRMVGFLTSDANGAALRIPYSSVRRIEGFSEYTGTTVMSPSGTEMAVSGKSEDGYAVWKGARRFGPFPESYTGLTYSPDGTFLELTTPESAESKLILNGTTLATGGFVRNGNGKPVAAVWEENGKIYAARF